MTLRIALVTLATEVFREQADKDYVVARAAYRMNLRDQFLWTSLQACEKYLKAILLFNNKSSRYDPLRYNPTKSRNKEFGHDAFWLLNVVVRELPELGLHQPDWLADFLKYLTRFGDNRYLSKATYATGRELRLLDEAVWSIRRVCQNFEWNAGGRNLRPQLIKSILSGKHRRNPAMSKPLGAIGGFLEKVISAPKTDYARRALVWNNLFFARRQRHQLTCVQFSSSENPPQTRDWFADPSITSAIDHYVKL